MEEEKEIETKLSTKKKHPSPSQTETTTNTPKVIPHSMNSNFKTIPPFPVSSSRSKKEDKEKEILEVFKKVNSTFLCLMLSSKFRSMPNS